MNDTMISLKGPDMNKTILEKKRVSVPIDSKEVELNTKSNRFYDTFKKLQTLNQHLELNVPQPSFKYDRKKEDAPKTAEFQQQQKQVMHKADKLHTITEYLKNSYMKPRNYFDFNEVKDHKFLISDKVSSQKKSEYHCRVTNDWKDFTQSMNKSFFDNNKLYIKSMADYKSKNIRQRGDFSMSMNYANADSKEKVHLKPKLHIMPSSQEKKESNTHHGSAPDLADEASVETFGKE